MFAGAIEIPNYRLYGPGKPFRIGGLNVPDGAVESGLNIIVGKNGFRKTSLLEALSAAPAHGRESRVRRVPIAFADMLGPSRGKQSGFDPRACAGLGRGGPGARA